MKKTGRFTGIIFITVVFLVINLFYIVFHSLILQIELSIISLLVFLFVSWCLGKKYDETKYFSEKDLLTQFYNRRFVLEFFPKLCDQAIRKNEKISVIIVDIDNFKQVNDQYGHQEGDRVLKSISQILFKNTRGMDIVSRWGGDEFLIIAPNTDENTVQEIMNRIELKIQSLCHMYECDFGISLGSATFPNEHTDLFSLIELADKKMYKTKSKKKKLQKNIIEI